MNFWKQKVKYLPLQAVVEVQESDTILTTLNEIKDKNVPCSLIYNDKKEISGIFTRGDFLIRYIGSDYKKNQSITTIMTKNPKVLQADDIIDKAIEFIKNVSIKHIPIFDNNKNVGLLSVRVLIQYMAEHAPNQVLNLPPDESIISTEAVGG